MRKKTSKLFELMLVMALSAGIQSAKANTATQKRLKTSKAELQCLASAIFSEARSEGTKGMFLVGHTVLNRAKSRKLSVCSTVLQKGQFSFIKKGKLTKPDEESEEVAHELLTHEHFGSRLDIVHGATHFARVNVKRRWMRGMKATVRYKQHVFYKEK